MAETKKTQYGPSLDTSYPPEMRTQLWPLCCGAAILSGFKNVGTATHEELVKAVNEATDAMIPDLQVYKNEQIRPKLMFLTLNAGQMQSAKIMAAVKEAGFVQFAEAKPRGAPQGFFVRDKSNSFVAAA